MANKFEVQVVALDRFTKTFRNLNNQASKAARPLVNIHRQVGALAKEMHLDKAAKGLGKVSDAAVTLTRTLGLSLGPLESVLGAGGIVGGLLAAGGAAIGLGVRFASAGFEVNRTSQRLGVSTDALQRYRGAMRLGGVDSDAFTSNLEALGNTLQDAKFGRNPLALQMLNKFGLSVHTGADGVIDTITTMKELAGVLQHVADPHVRAIIAGAFGLQDALPVLMKGPEAVENLANEAARLGVVAGPQALKWSDDFTTSLNHLKVAADGVANTVGSKMVPVLTTGLDALTKGIRTGGWQGGLAKLYALSPDPVSQALAGGLKSFASPATTPDQRTVSGQIGGSLQQGPYRAPGGAVPMNAAPPAGVVRSAAEQQMAGQMGFTPAELERQQADEDSAGNRRELMREIQRTRDPANRALLQGEMNKIDQRMQLEVTFKGLPSGMTATARGKTENAFVPTRIAYSMPGDSP